MRSWYPHTVTVLIHIHYPYAIVAVMKTAISKAFSNFQLKVRPHQSCWGTGFLDCSARYRTLLFVRGSWFRCRCRVAKWRICDTDIPSLPRFPDSSAKFYLEIAAWETFGSSVRETMYVNQNGCLQLFFLYPSSFIK